jgi:hypothetical protein
MSPRLVIVSAIVLGSIPAHGFAQRDGGQISRVRSANPAIAPLIEQGVARSKTFRDLVSGIAGTDGLVYVEEGKCGRGAHACLVLSVTVAGPYRLLRIQLASGRPARRRIASIGHELHHALDVLNQPTVRSDAAIFHYFLRAAPTGGERFETVGAIRTELDVYAELGSDD